MTDGRRIDLLDLTVEQTEALELEFGKPIDEWTELPSRAMVLRRVYVTVTGADDATVRGMSMRELADAVSLTGEDTETANPTQSPPSTG